MGKGKMKRLLAMLLCVTQLVGYVPHVHAEEACTHPNGVFLEDGTQKNTVYKDNGNGSHTRTFDVYHYYRCDDCGTAQYEVYMERGSEVEEHRYSDGVCKKCNAVEANQAACEHKNTVDLEDGRQEGTTYSDNKDGKTHDRTFTVIRFYECTDCGKTIEKDGGPGTETDEHRFENGACKYCGAAEPHTHNHVVTGTEDVVTYENQSISGHTKVTTTVTTYACDCGDSYTQKGEPDTYNDLHKFTEVNGEMVCVCEWVCPHTYSTADTKNPERGDYTGYAKMGETEGDYAKYHKHLYAVYVKSYCNACGMLTETDTIEGYEAEEHIFKDGDSDSYKSDYKDNGDGTCTPWVEATQQHICETCGYDYWTHSSGNGEPEAHVMENGACVNCKYTEHVHVYDQTKIKSVTYEQLTNGHRTVSEKIYYCACDEAEIDTSKTEYVYGAEEAHTYGEDNSCVHCKAEYQAPVTPDCTEHDWFNGICQKCKMQCQHPEADRRLDSDQDNWLDPKYGSATPYTAEQNAEYYLYHRRSYDASVNELCGVCGEIAEFYVPVKDLGAAERHGFAYGGKCNHCAYQCQHSYGANNACIWCSTVKPCDEHTWDEDGWGTCTTCGTVCGHDFDGANCTICGYVCSHSFGYNNGVCVVCGMPEGGAEHSHSFVPAGTPEITYSYEKTANTHTKSKTTTQKMMCECGKQGEDEVETQTYDAEAHSFSDGKCTVCGYEQTVTCTHAKVEWTTDRDYGNNTVTADNGLTHSGMATVETYGVCLECGEKVESETEEKVYSETHDYMGTSDTCAICGYKTKCGHEEQETTECEYPDEVTRDDDNTHTGTYIYCTETYCLLCGQMVSYTEDVTIQKTGPHIYINGVCECGDESDCGHDNVTPESYIDNHRDVKVVDAETHSYIVDRYAWNVCDDCGETLYENTVEKGVTVTEEHTFNADDVCIYCEYEKQDASCQHPNKTIKSTGVRLADGETWANRDDAEFHYGKGYDVVTYSCPDCEETFTVVSDVLEEQAMRHRYENDGDVCTECGYEITCQHPAEDMNVWYEYVLVDGESWTITANGHTGLSTTIEHYYCDACNKGWTETDNTQKNNTGEHELHDGVCDICGYTNTCTHPVGSVGQRTDYEPVAGEDWIDNGDGTHYANAYAYHYWYCEECGEDGYTEEGPSLYYDEHHYDEDGKCYACGAANTCTHKNADAWENYRNSSECVAVDALNHKHTADVYEIVWCDDCDTELSETLIGLGMEIISSHYFEDGVCDSCGYETLCDHSEYEEIEWYSLINEGTPVDDKIHTGLFRHTIDKWCLLCAAYLGETVVSESVEHTERHYFYEGECGSCGYISGCAHENTYSDVWYGDEKNPTYIDEYTHSLTVTEYTDVYCEDCEEWIEAKSSEKENVTITEYHRLNSNGICVYCGEAGQVPADPTPTPAPTEAPTATPTVAPTATVLPTAAPTAAPTPEPEEEEEDYFVPTPRPNTNNNYRPAATAVPTAVPTPVSTAEPTPIPTVIPTAIPTSGEPEMVSTLVETVAAAEAEGSVVTIEIVGAQEVFTEEEHEQLKELPVAEQILVTLSTIGFGDVVEAAMTSMNVTLSENAAQLVTQANATMEKMTEVERTEMQKTIEKNFPKTQVQIDGVVYDYFILEMEIVVDGVARVESYGFRYDETLGQWIFVRMDTLEADTAA